MNWRKKYLTTVAPAFRNPKHPRAIANAIVAAYESGDASGVWLYPNNTLEDCICEAIIEAKGDRR